MTPSFIPFPSIGGFHNVVKTVAAYPHLSPTPITYRGKIKLHGTNAGVRIQKTDGGTVFVEAQSRSQIITTENDNAGFAAWVSKNKSFFGTLQEVSVSNHKDVTIFGEWCGPGIQSGTAINKIPKKIFAIFAIHVGENAESGVVYVHPHSIESFLGANKPDDIHILPWHGDEFTVDYSDQENLERTVANINTIVEQVEPVDPWVKATFGVDGIAEGVVYVPVGENGVVSRKLYSDLAFKAKGEKHKVVKTKQAVQINPEAAASIGDFVSLFVTDARLEQGLAAQDGNTEMRLIGPFLKWVCQDVKKESVAELEASQLQWSQVEKSVQTAARNWYIVKNKAITC